MTRGKARNEWYKTRRGMNEKKTGRGIMIKTEEG